MTRALLVLILLSVPGCQAGETPAPPESPESTAVEVEAAPAQTGPAPAFVGKAWFRESPADPPGGLRIFLTDGTLLMDSCWETYRLAQWRPEAANLIVLIEDGIETRTETLQPSPQELVLRLQVGAAETMEERYRLASVPYVCPDMPR
jgi:hypothetical protein